MSRKLWNRLVLSLIWFVGLPSFAKSMSDGVTVPGLKITVRVFNFAQVTPETWNSAQKVAARIFSRTGIDTVWLDCHLSSEGTYTLPECDGPVRPTELILRLVPVSPATRAQFGDGTLGIAAQPEERTLASASIFYERVRGLAKGGTAPIGVILGHAVAHEIGHLLLGSNSHSPMGLMRAKWSLQDLQHANGGELLFLLHEGRSIREELQRRTKREDLMSTRNATDFQSRI